MKEININFDYSKVEGSTEMHNKFKKEFMIFVSRTFLDVMILPYDVAFVRAYSNPDICFQMGMKGVPDTIVFGNGWYELLDMKTGKARFQKNQKLFQKRLSEINDGTQRVHKITSVAQGLDIIKGNYK